MIITETKNNRFLNPFKVRKLNVFDFASSFVVSTIGFSLVFAWGSTALFFAKPRKNWFRINTREAIKTAIIVIGSSSAELNP
jgi:hypothetical protein